MRKFITEEMIFIDGQWSLNNINNYIWSPVLVNNNELVFQISKNIFKSEFELYGTIQYIIDKSKTIMKQSNSIKSMECVGYIIDDKNEVCYLELKFERYNNIKFNIIKMFKNKFPNLKTVKLNLSELKLINDII